MMMLYIGSFGILFVFSEILLNVCMIIFKSYYYICIMKYAEIYDKSMKSQMYVYVYQVFYLSLLDSGYHDRIKNKSIMFAFYFMEIIYYINWKRILSPCCLPGFVRGVLPGMLPTFMFTTLQKLKITNMTTTR